eukprot:TRINITY_DN18208_c0_g1_i1.p1 TRINITY_DN18208_c0_g1~~TRINITY_DN18208_c0_g1_i1.p1  ORF type:complete len:110 (-),score=7.10 TRINITY_DN18208_c0_g1_i1:135-464(-)
MRGVLFFVLLALSTLLSAAQATGNDTSSYTVTCPNYNITRATYKAGYVVVTYVNDVATECFMAGQGTTSSGYSPCWSVSGMGPSLLLTPITEFISTLCKNNLALFKTNP